VLGAFANFTNNPAVTEFWDSCVSTLADPIDPAIAREFQASTLARSIPDDYFETVVGESLKMPARVWRAAFEGLFADHFASELHRISTPTLILWAEQDAFCPHEQQTALLAGIAGSQMLTYDGAGHALHWEEPERFASDVAAFALASIATAAH
jgi:non-heme chloroperoxidase